MKLYFSKLYVMIGEMSNMILDICVISYYIFLNYWVNVVSRIFDNKININNF